MLWRKDNGSTVAKSHGVERSPKWDKVRKEYLKKEPYCAACKKSILNKVLTFTRLKALQVHHRVPFHAVVALGRPDLELDHRNLITLCDSTRGHHLLLGHLDDYQSFNLNVREDAEKHFHGKTKKQILKDPDWLNLEKNRPKRLADIADAEKKRLREFLDKEFPVSPA